MSPAVRPGRADGRQSLTWLVSGAGPAAPYKAKVLTVGQDFKADPVTGCKFPPVLPVGPFVLCVVGPGVTQTATTVTGSPGNDTIDCTNASPGKTITGGDGNDTITGTKFGDVINGGHGKDPGTGGAGARPRGGGPRRAT